MVSTKFPIRTLLPRMVPGLRLANGPTEVSLPILESSERTEYLTMALLPTSVSIKYASPSITAPDLITELPKSETFLPILAPASIVTEGSK